MMQIRSIARCLIDVPQNSDFGIARCHFMVVLLRLVRIMADKHLCRLLKVHLVPLFELSELFQEVTGLSNDGALTCVSSTNL